MSISYEQGYKYQLRETYRVNVAIYPREDIITSFISLDTLGNLTIREGYAWDGASGPAIDTKTIMRGSLVHDALYQLLRLGHLQHDPCFHQANRELYCICLEDGMWRVRAWWVFNAVERLGSAFAAVQPDKILTAP